MPKRYKLYDTLPATPLLISETRGLPGMKSSVGNLIDAARTEYVAPLDALEPGTVIAGADGVGSWTRVSSGWIGYPEFGSSSEVALQLVGSGGGVILIRGGIILSPPAPITPTP